MHFTKKTINSINKARSYSALQFKKRFCIPYLIRNL